MSDAPVLSGDEPSSMPSERTMRGGDPDTLGRIDHYDLLRKLGGGGFGVVYLARDTVGGIEVALKTLHPLLKRNAEEVEALRVRFALVSRLSHPNIATALVLHPVREANVWDDAARRELKLSSGDSVMVMRYAPGATLDRWRRQFEKGIVPLGKVVEIARQVASALDYAHSEKVLHRDVSPRNIMVETLDGGALRVRVLDFGLASEIRSSLSRVSGDRGGTSGTRPYMAPEVWCGRKQDHRTDQYSFACVLYEALTGAPPFGSVFETDDPAVIRAAVENDAPFAVENVPDCVNEAFGQALAKSRHARFPTCKAFVDALSGTRAPSSSASRPLARSPAAGTPERVPSSALDDSSSPSSSERDGVALEASVLARRRSLAGRMSSVPGRIRSDPELASLLRQAETAMGVAEDAVRIGRFPAADYALAQAEDSLAAIPRVQAERERRIREAEVRRREAEESARRKAAAEAEAKKKAREEARRKAAAEAAAKKRAEDEARRRAAMVDAKKKAEEYVRRQFAAKIAAERKSKEAEARRQAVAQALTRKWSMARASVRNLAEKANAFRKATVGWSARKWSMARASVRNLAEKANAFRKATVGWSARKWSMVKASVRNLAEKVKARRKAACEAIAAKKSLREETRRRKAAEAAEKARLREAEQRERLKAAIAAKRAAARKAEERKAREEAERKAREEAERKAREEAERKAREEAELKAREEAERKAREEAERKAREEAERKAREEAERKAREESERKAWEEAELKAREEMERKSREEAERKVAEKAERKGRAGSNEVKRKHVVLLCLLCLVCLALAINRAFQDTDDIELVMVCCPDVEPRFWMGKCEVTQKLWKRVMGTNPSKFKGMERPVESVSWYDCTNFIAKLNALPAAKNDKWLFRLPTEKEWETACRPGALDSANDCKLSEWTQNTSAVSRVCCGGRFHDNAHDCTASSSKHDPDFKSEDIGFRLCAIHDGK